MNASRQPDPTDVTDEEWALLEPLLPAQKPGPGRPRTVDLREIYNALRSQLRTGGQGDLLPHDFPHRSAVRYYFDRWTADGTLQRINDARRERVRAQEGRAGRHGAPGSPEPWRVEGEDRTAKPYFATIEIERS